MELAVHKKAAFPEIFNISPASGPEWLSFVPLYSKTHLPYDEIFTPHIRSQ